MGAAAPPATTMSAASLTPLRCGTRNRAIDSGSATVADSPMERICGASRHSRARPSDSRSPRFEVTSACNSSSTMRLSDENRNGRRTAALTLTPRHRRVAGAGLDLDRQTHLGNRRSQIARDIDRERLQWRDVEGVKAAATQHTASGGNKTLPFTSLLEGEVSSRRLPGG